MKRALLIAALGALLGGCTIDGQPVIQPVTGQDPPAEVHLAAPAVTAEAGPQSF